MSLSAVIASEAKQSSFAARKDRIASSQARLAMTAWRTSPHLRRNILNPRALRGDFVEPILETNPLVRRRLLCGTNARPPFIRRPDRPRRKAAAAVRADIVQLVLGAVGAEGALIAADARLRRRWRKVLVAIFAVRSQLQRHGGLDAGARPIIANRVLDSNGEYPSISATPIESCGTALRTLPLIQRLAAPRSLSRLRGGLGCGCLRIDAARVDRASPTRRAFARRPSGQARGRALPRKRER